MAILKPVAPHFCPEGRLVSGDQILRGHINRTYVSTIEEHGTTSRYVQQWINTAIFRDPPRMMENIRKVVEHIQGKRAGEEGLLRLIADRSGQTYWVDDEGGYWRMYNFVEDTDVYDVVPNATVAYEAARTFGRFLSDLADLDPSDFHVTIPGFHDTPGRLAAFESVLADPVVGRRESAADEIEFVKGTCHIADRLTRVVEDDPSCLRVTHNDTKVNNVLFSSKSGKGLTVIDLDTVMPGTVLFDVGDLVRTACNSAAEDEPDLAQVKFMADRFGEIVRGFAETMGHGLTEAEWSAMAYAGPVITFECGVRFLSDHLDGDRYFQIHRKDHNLHRARVQFELVRQMLGQMDGLQAAVASARADC